MKNKSIDNQNTGKFPAFALLFMVGVLFSSLLLTPVTNENIKTFDLAQQPKAAAGITLADITTNISSVIYRGWQTMNITLNTSTSGYILNDYWFVTNISFVGNLNYSINMTQIGTGPLFTCDWTPSITDPAGSFNASVLVIRKIDDAVMDQLNLTRTLLNNKPQAGISLNSNELKRNQSLIVNVTPSDIETPRINLTWKVELYNSLNVLSAVIIPLTNINTSAVYVIPATIGVGFYYINSTCFDPIESNSIVYNIVIRNQDPIITSASVNQTTVLRGNQTFIVSANATDGDSLDSLKMKLTTRDPKTGTNLFVVGYDSINPIEVGSGIFVKECSLPYTASLGKMQIFVEMFDANEATSKDIETLEIEVLNNAPQFLNFSINNKTDGNFVFTGNEEVTFGFWASDQEGTLRYAKVQIISESNSTYGNYNFTFDMRSNQANFTIFTKDIPVGQYVLYAYVIDADGAQTKTTMVFNVLIKQDVVETNLPWIMLGIGLLVGIAVSAFAITTKQKKEETRIIKDSKVLTKSEAVEQKPLTAAQKKKLREMRKLGKVPKDERENEEEMSEDIEDAEEQKEETEEVEKAKEAKETSQKSTTKFKKRL